MTEAAVAIEIEDDLAKVGVTPAVQSRSRALRDRLIREALAIARNQPFDDVSIIDICAAASCSTGAFYSRFPDKITLFKAVMVFAAAESGPLLEGIVREAPFEEILPRLVKAQVDRYLRQSTFFRSAFKVSLDAEQAWEPFRRNAQNLASAYIERLLALPAIDAEHVSLERVRFAFQVMYGVLNNTLINRPGPFVLESDEFPALLEDAMLATMKLPSIPA
jgi:AcrR family transcriptional regulator